MATKIIQARECHRQVINQLIISAKISSPIKGPIKNFFVVKSADKVVACAAYEIIRQNAATLLHCAVDKEFRHRGIGSSLIDHRLKILRKKGIKIVAFVTMYYLYNFYKKWDFRTCPRELLPMEIRNYWMFTAQHYKKCAVMMRYL